MRKLILPVLLLSCAAPALAAPGDRDHGRAERSAGFERAREARSDNNDDDRRRRAPAVQQEQRSDREQRADRREEPRRAPLADRPVQVRREVVQQQRQQQADTVRSWRERERQRTARPSLERREAPVFGSAQSRRDPSVREQIRRTSVDLSRAAVAHQWRNDWRRDRRYDWRSHRSRHTSLFRLGFYYDPFGYSYRRFGYGYRLFPAYYGSRYWLNDPFMYRLPPAWGPYRWVRYWDDALLVDTRSGMVVDVIYDFFW